MHHITLAARKLCAYDFSPGVEHWGVTGRLTSYRHPERSAKAMASSRELKLNYLNRQYEQNSVVIINR
jgi:hypothetical protein